MKKIIFLISSSTINLDNYNIKDISGSSGRLDVISRCILASILNVNKFEDIVQIWVFLNKYGSFLFDPNLLSYEIFPKNEILLSDYLVDLLKTKTIEKGPINNPLSSVIKSDLNIFEALNKLMQLNFDIYTLKEKGDDFFKFLPNIKRKRKIAFVIGSQTGDFINSEELNTLNFLNLSFGKKSYLASSVIRLIKYYLELV